MNRDALISCPAVLAMELPAGANPAHTMLSREQADVLAELVAQDLRDLLPGVEEGRLALVGAHFDAVELLRPGFPLFNTLQQLATRLPREAADAGVVAFGSHEGRMPAPALTPDSTLGGGAMRLVPWTLLAPPQLADALGKQMEVELVGRGEAGARTADFLMRQLGVELEHVRYLSRNDLMALTCVQYEHVNLAALWQLLEAALLAPESAESALTAHGLPLRYTRGQVTAQAPADWLTAAGRHGDAHSDAHTYAAIIFELRQYAALLDAHRLALQIEHAERQADGRFWLQTLAAADATLEPPQLFIHEAPGLGAVTVTVAQCAGQRSHLLAHAYLLAGDAETVCTQLREQFDASSPPQRLGRVHIADGCLDVPFTHPLH